MNPFDLLQSIPAHVQTIIVSKNQSIEKIEPFLKQGYRHFGENRLEEAEKKWILLKKRYPDVHLHFIGSLQSKKMGAIYELFDTLHSFDRLRLISILEAMLLKRPKDINLFIQVNTGNEIQKSGVLIKDLSDFIKKTHELPIKGFMCIPPKGDMPSLHFAFLEKLAKKYKLNNLSMGMSGDYLEAIDLGATHIRLGRILFEHTL